MEIYHTRGLSVAEVAAATGLERGELYRVQGILALGAPAHFAYASSTQVYTPAGLCQMAEGLDRLGHGVAAAALRVKLSQFRELVAVTSAPVAGWMAAQEAKEDTA